LLFVDCVTVLQASVVEHGRYGALKPLEPGIRRYNMFWNTFEPVPSRKTAFACPAQSTLFPPTEVDRVKLGYHKFHCYDDLQAAKFDTILALDASIGAQGAAIIYSVGVDSNAVSNSCKNIASSMLF
jgi:hypothetical protein